MNLRGAKIIDFTGTVNGADRYDRFSQKITDVLRQEAKNKTAVVFDRGFGFDQQVPHLVSDHLNFVGTNPLVGPNHPIGQRFPVVNEIYLTEFHDGALAKMPRGIVAGLKAGLTPNSDEEKFARAMGANFFSYNVVPTMIVAAHAGWKVLAIVIPQNSQLDKEAVTALLNQVN